MILLHLGGPSCGCCQYCLHAHPRFQSAVQRKLKVNSQIYEQRAEISIWRASLFSFKVVGQEESNSVAQIPSSVSFSATFFILNLKMSSVAHPYSLYHKWYTYSRHACFMFKKNSSVNTSHLFKMIWFVMGACQGEYHLYCFCVQLA